MMKKKQDIPKPDKTKHIKIYTAINTNLKSELPASEIPLDLIHLSPCPIHPIDISDEEDPFDGNEAERLFQIYAQNKNEAIAEISSLNTELTDASINHLCHIINDVTGFRMQDVTYIQRIEYYRRADDRDDVQIIFEGGGRDFKNTGHWKCIYYNSVLRQVWVYDSLYRGSLTEVQREIIRR